MSNWSILRIDKSSLLAAISNWPTDPDSRVKMTGLLQAAGCHLHSVLGYNKLHISKNTHSEDAWCNIFTNNPRVLNWTHRSAPGQLLQLLVFYHKYYHKIQILILSLGHAHCRTAVINMYLGLRFQSYACAESTGPWCLLVLTICVLFSFVFSCALI